MTEKDLKSVKLDNVYFIRPEKEFYDKDSSNRYYNYSYRTFIQNSEIVFEGPHILPQITYAGEVDAHYVKNSFKNFKFESTEYSSDNSLKVKLKLENGSVHDLLLSNSSIGSLLLEADIDKGLIKSECCFLPSATSNSSNTPFTATMVVKEGKLHKKFIEKQIVKSDVELLKAKELKTGQIHNIINKYEDISVFLGFVYEVKVKDMVLDPTDLKTSKKRVFLSYKSSDSNSNLISQFLDSGSGDLGTNFPPFSNYTNPIENAPKVASGTKLKTLKTPKNLKNILFNGIFKYNSDLERKWCYNPKFYFSTKEEAQDFRSSISYLLSNSSSSTGSIRPGRHGYYSSALTTNIVTSIRDNYKNSYFKVKERNKENILNFVYD